MHSQENGDSKIPAKKFLFFIRALRFPVACLLFTVSITVSHLADNFISLDLAGIFIGHGISVELSDDSEGYFLTFQFGIGDIALAGLSIPTGSRKLSGD